MVERDELKTRIVKVSLSEEALRMLEEMGARYFPGRPRVQSQTVEKLVRERYERERSEEAKR
jgi:metal-responsive CopG/Arc/MetJ family transcriptional regulator